MAVETQAVAYTAQQAASEQVQQQLERLLISPTFRNSQRYPALLRYVVEQTLAGNADQLKERTLGVTVFHRLPDYDTNADPVVRVTAGEVRKRLAQYYQEHSTELRIDLPPGSYVPFFRPSFEATFLAAQDVAASPETHRADATQADAAHADAAQIEEAAQEEAPAAQLSASGPVLPGQPVGRRLLLWVMLAGLVLSAAAGLFFALRPVEPLQAFWAPMTGADRQPAFILGGRIATYIAPDNKPLREPHLLVAPTVATDPIERVNTIAVADALSFARVASLLSRRGATYVAMSAQQSSLEDLRARPSVLFGAFNNSWTMHATDRLRFRLRYDSQSSSSRIVWIEDSLNPASRKWSLDYQQPTASLTRDYAVVARYADPMIEQETVIAAGLGENGTMAASEFVTNNHYLKQLDAFAPRKTWATHNFEAVLETEVVGGRSGPPKVVAAYFW